MILQTQRTCNGQEIDNGFGDVGCKKWSDPLSNKYATGARFEVGLRQIVTPVRNIFSTHDVKAVYNASVKLWCGYTCPTERYDQPLELGSFKRFHLHALLPFEGNDQRSFPHRFLDV